MLFQHRLIDCIYKYNQIYIFFLFIYLSFSHHRIFISYSTIWKNWMDKSEKLDGACVSFSSSSSLGFFISLFFFFRFVCICYLFFETFWIPKKCCDFWCACTYNYHFLNDDIEVYLLFANTTKHFVFYVICKHEYNLPNT